MLVLDFESCSAMCLLELVLVIVRRRIVRYLVESTTYLTMAAAWAYQGGPEGVRFHQKDALARKNAALGPHLVGFRVM